MFTTKRTIISGFILLLLCTCSYPDTPSSKGGQSATTMGSNSRQKDFLDSVQAKMNFTFSQVKQYTNIDNIYYQEHVKFLGDTVWYHSSKHPLAIIRCRVGGINKKLLLVFNRRSECTASLMVGMDGEVDSSFDRVVLNCKILNDNSFSTTETLTYRGGNGDDKVTVTKQFYQINKKGSILAQNNIIHSFTTRKEQVARR